MRKSSEYIVSPKELDEGVKKYNSFAIVLSAIAVTITNIFYIVYGMVFGSASTVEIMYIEQVRFFVLLETVVIVGLASISYICTQRGKFHNMNVLSLIFIFAVSL